MTPSNTGVDKSFKKIYRGIGYYARVKLELFQSTCSLRSDITIEENDDLFQDWALLVRQGIMNGIHYLQRHGDPPSSGTIQILEIIGTVADTTDDAMVCVGFMAVCELLDPVCVLPPLSADRPWRFEIG